MIEQRMTQGLSLVLMSLYAAMVLQIFPMTSWLSYLRPNWILLLVLFWAYVLPGRFGLFFALLVGVLTDLLLDSVFGIHALSMLVIVYLQLLLHRQIRIFSGVQQFLLIFFFSFLYLLSLRLLEGFFGKPAEVSIVYWLPTLTNALVWPWLLVVMDNLKLRFNIYENNG